MMQWRLEEMAREERKKNRKSEVRYAKIQMREKWWRWDKNRKKIVDWEGRSWEDTEGKGLGTKEKVMGDDKAVNKEGENREKGQEERRGKEQRRKN